jgi:hypothetical protein
MSANTSSPPSEASDGARAEPRSVGGPSEDRRAVLESIAFGSDLKITPADRLRALELLREFEIADPAAELDPDEIEAEIDAFHDAMLTAMFIASGPDLELDPAKFPRTAQRLREVVGRMTELAIGDAYIAGEQGPET